MADSDHSPSATASANKFTAAQRIAELNEIDQSVSGLLASAAEAIGVLANKRDENTPFATFEAQQDKFARAADAYFSALSFIEVRLKRQVYALEEAGLIQEGQDKDAKRAKTNEGGFDPANGGGPLDPSWLNARADDSVEFKMERELLDQAKSFLETKRNERDAGDQPS
ncbi:uncharacterized protein HMPREF1541_10318 [Cyphellophora europaea CBS 101466]|uniref:Mediator of RNA polymerase II transcription subunit 11 n=1 Tax=Cyphellophora europaea (strain CBS 101466) TaxID=1220924 RepID=W2S9D6_CYPE1|nr:uncharacterized protein HMPREF1541_10318 [Cyphellophora europaea CBS 101466]ETN44648.1 hypothetical protein HMPREF1541_10318 [Cyphellophora europaea CBS 101466]